MRPLFQRAPGVVDYGNVRNSLGLPDKFAHKPSLYVMSPTAKEVHNARIESTHGKNRVDVRLIRGPVGCGKTVILIQDPLIQLMRSEPCIDGVRRGRVTFIRNTYPELVSTLIKTFQDWFSPEQGYPKVKYGSPISWEYRWEFEGQPPMVLECWFLAMDRPSDASKARGLETTWVNISEGTEVVQDTIEIVPGRAGRYPGNKMRPPHISKHEWPSIYGTLIESNSPSDSNWWYRYEKELQPEGWQFWVMPGGLEPDAENIDNLPGGRMYYHRQTRGKSQEWIDAFVHNRFATQRSGLPVWPEYNQQFHRSKEPIRLLKNRPVILAWDFGGTPACVALQITGKGQIRFIREWVTWNMEKDKLSVPNNFADGGRFPYMGTARFVKQVVKPAVAQLFGGMELQGVGDGSGVARESDERSAISWVQEHLPCEPCETNVFETRRRAMAERLDMVIDGEPAILVDSKYCRVLDQAMHSGYSMDRIQVVGPDRYKDKPNKTPMSHCAEAAAYGVIKAIGLQRITPLPGVVKRRYRDPAFRV